MHIPAVSVFTTQQTHQTNTHSPFLPAQASTMLLLTLEQLGKAPLLPQISSKECKAAAVLACSMDTT